MVGWWYIFGLVQVNAIKNNGEMRRDLQVDPLNKCENDWRKQISTVEMYEHFKSSWCKKSVNS